ncbi:hypothetical protein CR513_41713, partial [Mucuna pruriens]
MAVNAIDHEDKRITSPSGESREAMVSTYHVEEESYLGQENDAMVTYLEGNGNPHPKPLIIQYNLAPKPKVPFIIQVPTRPVYNNKEVPWNYSTEEPPVFQIKKETIDPEVTNIAGVRGMMRSGRVFAPEVLRSKDPTPTKKEKIVEPPKKALTEEEAQEFLKVIQHIKCGNYMIARVLINNGCSLNVMPKTTLDKLYAPGAILKNSPVVVRAFDRSKREVMDIRPAYNCLLGRPWIHDTGAVPSSLHQKVKFVADGRLINVLGEKEMMYVEGDEEALETTFQALEIVGTTRVEGEKGIPKPSKAAIMAAKILINNGFEPGKGLRKKLDDIAKLVKIQENPGQARLSYNEMIKKGKPGSKVPGKQLIKPNLYQYFSSGGIMILEQVAAVKNQLVESAEWVHPMALDTKASSQINNATFTPDDIDKCSRQEEEEEIEEETLRELESTEELEVINLSEGEGVKEIWVGKLILMDVKQGLTELLREYANIFAWSYRDMLGLDTTIVEHRLPLNPDAILVQQQLRRMKPEVALKIKEEVEKQWNVGFLAVAKYPQWVANIVLVLKKDGKV